MTYLIFVATSALLSVIWFFIGAFIIYQLCQLATDYPDLYLHLLPDHILARFIVMSFMGGPIMFGYLLGIVLARRVLEQREKRDKRTRMQKIRERYQRTHPHLFQTKVK